LSTSQLANWLQDPEREPPLLLDVREKEEFAVSHLPGARWLSPHAKESELKALAALGRPLVLYCSVGIRSSKMVVRLQAHTGDGQLVYNLDGSLFRWANEKRMLHDVAGKKVAVVHPYDALWGRFLAGHVTSSILTIDKR
jgi:rhodanese-related sulfurtransferase